MIRISFARCLPLSIILLLISSLAASATEKSGGIPKTGPSQRLDLHSGWQIQSSCVLSGAPAPAELKPDPRQVSGAQISSPSYQAAGWMPATVPTTVVATQVANGIIKDPFFGKNLLKLPGMDYPIGGLFSNLSMLDTSPYKCGWWYRTEFRLPADFAGHQVALHLDGVNYRADVWLNGKQVANKNDIAGTWRVFEFNLTDALFAGKPNTSPSKSSPRPRKTSASPGSTGTHRRPTRTPASSARSTSPPAAPLSCAFPTSRRSSKTTTLSPGLPRSSRPGTSPRSQ